MLTCGGLANPPLQSRLTIGCRLATCPTMLRERLAQVEERMETAARRAGRKRSDITLVAVTKKFCKPFLLEYSSTGRTGAALVEPNA